MNQSLNAQKTRLSLQKNELEHHLSVWEKEILSLQDDLHHLEHSIVQSNTTSLIINPEIEINKLNYLIQQQEKKDQLLILLKNKQQQKQQFQEKLLRVQSELKMLERYMEQQKQEQARQHLLAQEKNIEEWVLQKQECL